MSELLAMILYHVKKGREVSFLQSPQGSLRVVVDCRDPNNRSELKKYGHEVPWCMVELQSVILGLEKAAKAFGMEDSNV